MGSRPKQKPARPRTVATAPTTPETSPKNVRKAIKGEAEAMPPAKHFDRAEVFTFFGHAAFWAQTLEGNLHNLAALVHLEVALTPETFTTAAAAFQRKTLGQLLVALRERVPVPSELDDELKDALETRNFLMHGFFRHHRDNYPTRKGRTLMIHELRAKTVILKQMALTLFGMTITFAQELHLLEARRRRAGGRAK